MSMLNSRPNVSTDYGPSTRGRLKRQQQRRFGRRPFIDLAVTWLIERGRACKRRVASWLLLEEDSDQRHVLLSHLEMWTASSLISNLIFR